MIFRRMLSCTGVGELLLLLVGLSGRPPAVLCRSSAGTAAGCGTPLAAAKADGAEAPFCGSRAAGGPAAVDAPSPGAACNGNHVSSHLLWLSPESARWLSTVGPRASSNGQQW